MMLDEKDNEIREALEEASGNETLGLKLSDVADHNVDDGVTDEVLFEEDDTGEDDDEDDEEEMMAKRRRRFGSFLAFLFGAACCLLAIYICTNVLGLAHFVSDPAYKYYKELDADYGKYYEIMKMIGEDPIAETSPQELSDAELKEIVSSIGDPYAEYYTATEYEDLQKRYLGDYVGIGIGVVQQDDEIVIMTVFEDTPAEAAGILPEDRIIKVDGKEPADVDEAVHMITGEAGTKVTVTVKRGDEILDFTVNRAKIETDSVGYSVLEGHPDIGYIAITSFIKGTDDEFKMAVKDLKAQGCTKFILDLRDNGGGLTDSSIEIADYLLPACRIMSENTKDGTETVYNSKESSADLEMVILVNENTASASEILTAALQDNNAGAVIGTVTYGKGVTQLVHQFADGSAVKLTTTEYFRPSGKTVHGVGITPDIEAEGEEVLDAALKELGE